MERLKLIAPAGIRYISDWAKLPGGYNLADYQFPHILDKKIPGCGYTEYCLTNQFNVILCSPRLALLENKLAQHEGELFYFKNDFESELTVDQDTTRDKEQLERDKSLEDEIQEEERTESRVITKEELRRLWLNKKVEELQDYMSLRMREYKPSKLIVTYDSFRILKEQLIRFGLFDNFFVVVDEFQSVFTDSAFKSSTELEFSYSISDVKNLCYVSATPMLDEYLEQLDEFKNLPYFEIDWAAEDPTRIQSPNLKVRFVQSIIKPAINVINKYLARDFDKSPIVLEDGSFGEVESREAVFYVNSVENIIQIISKAKLLPEQCNILCSKTKFNDRRIKKKLGYKWEIGTIPLKGEPHKMFTFCTRTVYLGADFYSTNAKSFVFSDANISSLMVDITIDLPQILGRQRLIENPWKNQADLFIKVTSPTRESKGKQSVVRTKEEFDAYIAEKIETTNLLLSGLTKVTPAEKHAFAKTYKTMAKDYHYVDNYIAVNTHKGSDLEPVFNKLVMLSEKRAFDLQSRDYKDRFSVFNSLTGNGFSVEKLTSLTKQQKLQEELQYFNSLTLFPDKMRYLCDEVSENDLAILLPMLPVEIRKYYEVLGPVRIKANFYRHNAIEKEYRDKLVDTSDIASRIYEIFVVGERYSRDFIKKTLQAIYQDCGSTKSVTAQTIRDYFIVEEKRILSTDKKTRIPGFLIIAKKETY